MIGEVDDRVVDWVRAVLGDVKTTLEGPAGGADGADVGLHLLELGDLPPARGERRAPLQVRVTYLVTTAGPDPREAHDRLGQLLFAAMEHEDFEVGFPAVPAAFWSAAGVAPRPGFALTVALRRAVEEQRPKPVLAPLVVRGAPVRPLSGVVLGPGDVPIADAFVELPALRVSTRSDRRGRFSFPSVPAGEGAQQVRVRAKAGEFPFSIARPSGDAPVALRIDPFKD